MESLGVVPGFMQALTAAQQGAASLISGAYSLVTPAELSSFATALGPLAAGNMIPSMFETTATNVASGMVTAGHHVGLGAATTAAQTSFTTADEAC